MGLFGTGGLKSAFSLAQLVGKDIVARSITLTQSATAQRFLSSLTGDTGVTHGYAGGALGVGSDSVGAGNLAFYSSSSVQWRINGATGDLVSPQNRNINIGSGDYQLAASGGYRVVNMFARSTAPTIAAGVGAAIVSSNGSMAFRVDLGAAAGTGTITLPTATTGWVLYMQCVTNPANTVISQTGTTTTTATFSSFARTTGLAANWAANENATCIAIAY